MIGNAVPVNLAYEIAVAIKLFLNGNGDKVIGIDENYESMCPTLTASMGIRENQVHFVLDDYGIRRLTVQECLDFQGFPSNFHFPHTITLNDAYKQIGNSVCVPVIRRIAERIVRLRID